MAWTRALCRDWIEKDALTTTFVSILEDRQIRVVINRGFSSVAFAHMDFERLKQIQEKAT